MLEKEFYISQLISSQIKNELSPEQEVELNAWLNENIQHSLFIDELNDQSKFSTDMNRYLSKDKAAIWGRIVTGLNNNKGGTVQKKAWSVWSQFAVAASIICILGVAAYFLNGHFRAVNGVQLVSGNDIRPGSNTATLILTNGKTMRLNGSKSAVVIDAEKITYNDGTNVISGAGTKAILPEKSIEMKIVTPRGGQYEAVLPDGTRVWLNAASALTFPSRFVGADRIVTLSGEAYFEVAKDKAHPFKVKTTQQEVEVLGTHFNLNSYTDEPTTNTTLFEGSVKINGQVVLEPGQQANLYRTGKVMVSAAAADAAAWKTGKFVFEDTDLETILRQLARWYDVDIVYPNGIPQEKFTGYIDRNLNAAEALNILKYTRVNFKIEGRKIIVIK